ncbi:MAG: hypothetical protein V4793_09740, partial [Paraburkholderia tropica]
MKRLRAHKCFLTIARAPPSRIYSDWASRETDQIFKKMKAEQAGACVRTARKSGHLSPSRLSQ